eukprot:gene8630-577_t
MVSYQKKLNGCAHYNKNCQIHCSVCDKFYTCRHCHNDATLDHEVDRFSVSKLKCLNCSTEQNVSNECKNCKIKFGDYHCLFCNLFVNKKENQPLNVFHCEKCKICRVGKREEYFHCDKCGCCMPISKEDTHECIENVLGQNCPICLEFLFTSTKVTSTMKCGHIIHQSCFEDMIENQNYKCPSCNKLIVELDDKYLDEVIEKTPMPDELKNEKVKILCNECQEKGDCMFHFYGLKCQKCGSYNTARI